MTNKILLIINPNAGKMTGYKMIISACSSTFPGIRIKRTTTKRDAEQFAYAAKEPVILVAGGDGTLNEVVNGILGSRKKKIVGLIPFGTSNMVSRAFQIPSSVSQSLRIIQKGKKRLIDVGKANKRYFLIGAGIGVDAEMYKNVLPSVKRIFGEVAYPLALVKTIMTHDPQKLIVFIGNKKVSCYYALICNIGTFSKIFSLLPETKYDDGFLDVLVFQNRDIASQFRYCYGLATQKHTTFPDVRIFKTKTVLITSKNKVLAHCDGEIIGNTPISISCLRKAVTLFVP